MAFYLGIDGGGTKTRCALGDENTVLATSISGGSNIVRLGKASAREAVHAALRQVSSTAKISASQVQSICVGAAGAARPEVAATLRSILIEFDPRLASAHIEVVGDTVIALEAAFGSGPGVVVIAGTGSIAFGRDGSGQIARAGGWGFAISDEGSGHWIGRQAVSAVLRARDQQHETLLTAMILSIWKLGDLDSLVQRANATPPPEFPRLFPVVLQASELGDSMAREILVRAGTELAETAANVVRRLAPQLPYVPVATTGSVFRQSADVRHVFYNHLTQMFPGIDTRTNFVEPVLGALARAREARSTRNT